MVIVGCAHELVVGSSDTVPDLLDLSGDAVDVFLRGDTLGVRLFLDLLTVLVGAGHQKDVVALLTLAAGDAVSHDGVVDVADMRL